MRSEDPTLGVSVGFSRHPGIYASGHSKNAREPPRRYRNEISLKNIPLDGYCADAGAGGYEDGCVE